MRGGKGEEREGEKGAGGEEQRKIGRENRKTVHAALKKGQGDKGQEGEVRLREAYPVPPPTPQLSPALHTLDVCRAVSKFQT